MTTIAFTGEDFARPAKQVRIEYKRNGELIKTKVREATYRALEDTKRRLTDATGKNYTQTVIVRRALDLYLGQLAKMDDGRLIIESDNLVRHR
jgi:hypothetical protein